MKAAIRAIWQALTCKGLEKLAPFCERLAYFYWISAFQQPKLPDDQPPLSQPALGELVAYVRAGSTGIFGGTAFPMKMCVLPAYVTPLGWVQAVYVNIEAYRADYLGMHVRIDLKWKTFTLN